MSIQHLTVIIDGKLRLLQSDHNIADSLIYDDEGKVQVNAVKPRVEIWTRVTPGEEYIKLVIFEERIIGALLIGATTLAETFENLILNQISVSHFGIALLDSNLDLEDYFD